MAQQKLQFSRFDLGLVTSSDVNTLEAPKNSLSSVRNFEINAPDLGLKESSGCTLLRNLPLFYGNRIVKHSG